MFLTIPEKNLESFHVLCSGVTIFIKNKNNKMAKIMNEYIMKEYEDYDDRVKMLLSRIYEDCLKNNDKLSNYFYVCLELLANQAKMYYLALDAIDGDNNVSSEDSYKRKAKNPAIAVMNHAHQEILNILQKLSLSPFEIAKLKRLDGVKDESAEEFLQKIRS